MKKLKVSLTETDLYMVLFKSKVKGLSYSDIQKKFACSQRQIQGFISSLRKHGYLISYTNNRWYLDKRPDIGNRDKEVFYSTSDNVFRFGFVSDNHLGSNYERLDVLNSLYDIFQNEGITRIYNSGNWIEGEKPHNRFECKVVGMEAQCNYLVANYPYREGIHTFAVAGDDHEGWYCQREGVDIGKYAELKMQNENRTDWHDLGYLEANINLKNLNSGRTAILKVMHPGGGSSYAISYILQKIIESFSPGEKPNILLAGHFHKFCYIHYRGVYGILAGTTQGQSRFMRKNRLWADVGGGICKLEQCPKSGAIKRCSIEFLGYYDKKFHQKNNWGV